MSIGFIPLRNEESDYTNRRVEESYDVGYVSGISEGVSGTARELQELREYKSKVEKFISKYDGLVMKVPVKTVIDNLKEALCYENQL